MTDKLDRKALKQQYKEEARAEVGIFSLTCSATGEVWVDSSKDLSASRNRVMFALKMGSTLAPNVRDAVKQYGADVFAFDVLELMDDELPQWELDARLKEQRLHWLNELGARSLFR